mmetsp:Transcript_5890/g.14354  ORF Transcript_5890/g.14354 Transcript_5890/m.14354 type:complete len:384 (+) Transcript_5890:139-1290(+)
MATHLVATAVLAMTTTAAAVAAATGAAAACATCQFVPRITPLHYVAYELDEHVDGPIDVDGRLDERAWQRVAWSAPFTDIKYGDARPPRFETRFKMRWSARRGVFYAAALLVETQVWANVTKDDEVVFHDNDVELFVDPAGDCRFYKEFELNARAVKWSLALDRPYIDGGSPHPFALGAKFERGVHIEGGALNDPRAGAARYWTAELALPFDAYVRNTSAPQRAPRHGEHWRMNWSRVEWRVRVVDGAYYQKVPDTPEDNWVWQRQYAVNMHLPERWGYVVWSSDAVNATRWAGDPQLPVRTALAHTYYGQAAYFAVNGKYTAHVDELPLPAFVLDGSLGTAPPKIAFDAMSPYAYTATVASTGAAGVVGTVDHQRHIVVGGP